MASLRLFVLLTSTWLVASQTADIQAKDACQSLKAKFPANVYMPGVAPYTTETQSYWSLAAWLQPKCVFAPSRSADLAAGVGILTQTNTTFAVRSGGHLPTAGIASTDYGVLIAMTAFTELSVYNNPNNPFACNYVRVGAANTWGIVYKGLSKYGLAVAGGRMYPVGTGALLGGALSFFGSQRGWGSNTVLNYELVTADAKVLQVNALSYPDLYWALKGGGNNFGIVTAYDMQTFKQGKIFGYNRNFAPEQYQKYSDAFTKYMLPGGGSDDPKMALMPSTQYTPALDRLDPSMVGLYDSPTANPAAFKDFLAINGSDVGTGVQNVTELVDQTIGYAARVLRWKWYVTCIKFNKEAFPLAIDTMTATAKELIPKFDGFVGISSEPITQKLVAAARANGGDPMNLDPANGGFLLALYYAAYTDPALDDVAENYLTTLISRVEKKTKAKGLWYNFYFLNYLGLKQDPFSSYGGSSLSKLKTISKKYDPKGVFQKLVPGFKLGYLLDGS